MGGLQNTFSFSFSSAAKFSECRRAWALRRSLAWGGWEKKAPPSRRHAYALSKMRNLAGLAGDLVHQIAGEAASGAVRDLSTALSLLESRWGHQVDRGRSEAWRHAGAKAAPPLFEKHYGTLTPQAEAAALDRARICVQNLMAMPELADIQATPKLRLEELESFDFQGLQIWAKPDLALEPKNGILPIWDWKTGRRRAKDAAQVLLYALFARERWGINPENVRLRIAYLADGSIDFVPVSVAELAQLEAQILRQAGEMRSLLPAPGEIVPDDLALEAFPRTVDLSICGRCELFESCKGHRDLTRPEMVAAGFE